MFITKSFERERKGDQKTNKIINGNSELTTWWWQCWCWWYNDVGADNV